MTIDTTKDFLKQIKSSEDWIEGVPNRIYRLRANIRYCISVSSNNVVLTQPSGLTKHLVVNNKEIINFKGLTVKEEV